MKSKLDTSALFHCAMAKDNFINAFRITITLKDEIDENLLQEVVNELISKYPTICSRITKDLFYYYTESLDSIKVQKDESIFTLLNNHSIYESVIAIFYKNKTISLELFHGVSDGNGMFVYIHDLISQYIYRKYNIKEQLSSSIEYQMIDSFIETPTNEYKKHASVSLANPFQFKKRDIHSNIKVTTFKINAQEIKDLSKQYLCTINEFLLSLFYRSILKTKRDKNVYISVPINLRRSFQSNTIKNFTLLANLHLIHKDDLSLNSLIKEINTQMKEQNNKEYLGYEIEKVKKLNIILDYFPVFLKNIAIRIGSFFVGNKTCMTISNVGNIVFKDEQVQAYIDSMDAILCPREKTPYNCGITTINNNMHINITHDEKNDRFVQDFEKELIDLNIQYHKKDYQERLNDC